MDISFLQFNRDIAANRNQQALPSVTLSPAIQHWIDGNAVQFEAQYGPNWRETVNKFAWSFYWNSRYKTIINATDDEPLP